MGPSVNAEMKHPLNNNAQQQDSNMEPEEEE